jgi:hypothetical protein
MMARAPKNEEPLASGAGQLLTDTEISAIRREISEAVIGTPQGLRDGLATDPNEFLRLVASSRTAAERTSTLLRDSIDSARAAGHSWDTLGRVLGVSRQAAQQRFGSQGAPPAASTFAPGLGDVADHRAASASPSRRVISPLTSFDEMAVLADEGRRGWHSIAYGTLYHLVEHSEWQWEHRRVVWSPISAVRRLEAEGWQLIGRMTFPWAYYARQLDLPADQD